MEKCAKQFLLTMLIKTYENGTQRQTYNSILPLSGMVFIQHYQTIMNINPPPPEIND